MNVSGLNPSLRMQAMTNEQYEQGAERAETDTLAAEHEMEEAQKAIEEARARQLAAEQAASRASFWEKSFDKVADVAQVAGALNVTVPLPAILLGANPVALAAITGVTAVGATAAKAVAQGVKAGHEHKADVANIDQTESRQRQEVAEQDKAQTLDGLAADTEKATAMSKQAKQTDEQERTHRQRLIAQMGGE